MTYDPEKHNRRSIRLDGYDYGRPGAYFVTICTYKRVCLFGEVVEGRMWLNEYGRIILGEWRRTERARDNVALDTFVIMPNHVHGIIVITPNPDGGGSTRGRGTARRAPTGTNRQFGQPRSGSLPTIVGAFKSAATRRINRLRDTPGEPVWQRNYYERIVRGRHDLERIRRYIRQNPARWHLDRNRPDRFT